MDSMDRRALAKPDGRALLKLDGLWSRSMPYIMGVHEAPTDGAEHPEAHVHIEIYPAYRRPDRLRYLAGSELGTEVFTADMRTEEKAAAPGGGGEP